MKAELMMKTNSELVAIYNDMDPPKRLTSWKKSKEILVDMIVHLENELKKLDMPDESVKKSKKSKEKKKRKRSLFLEGPQTIREYSIELLCRVVHYEDRGRDPGDDNKVPPTHPNARSVGYSYQEIIAEIKKRFPDAETTPECLRWYAVKIRLKEEGYEGFRLAQRRPRPKMPKKAKPAEAKKPKKKKAKKALKSKKVYRRAA